MKRIFTGLLLSFLFLNICSATKISPPRQKFISCALELRGIPYKWGGQTPGEGLDCSGLINYVNQTALNGHTQFPRKAKDIYDSLVHIEKKQREPADLVFFSDYEGGPIFHVGIYCGVYPKNGPEEKFRGKRVFVSALSKGESGVKISLMDEGYWTNYHPVYARFLRSTKDYNKGLSEEKSLKKDAENAAKISKAEDGKKTSVKENAAQKKTPAKESKKEVAKEQKKESKPKPQEKPAASRSVPRKKTGPKLRTKNF